MPEKAPSTSGNVPKPGPGKPTQVSEPDNTPPPNDPTPDKPDDPATMGE